MVCRRCDDLEIELARVREKSKQRGEEAAALRHRLREVEAVAKRALEQTDEALAHAAAADAERDEFAVAVDRALELAAEQGRAFREAVERERELRQQHGQLIDRLVLHERPSKA